MSGRDEQTRPSMPAYWFLFSGASFVAALGAIDTGAAECDRLWSYRCMGTRMEGVVNQREGRWMVCEEITGKVVYSRTNKWGLEPSKYRWVSISYLAYLNLLRPSGYYTYHQIYRSKLLRSAHTVYLCVLCGFENKQRLPIQH